MTCLHPENSGLPIAPFVESTIALQLSLMRNIIASASKAANAV